MPTKLAWIISILLFTANGVFAATIVLNTADEYPLSTIDGRGYEDQIVSEAFRRIGVDVKISHLPSERALVNADRGIDDGNFARIAGLERIYPNLVIVPEKLTDFEFTAFSKDPSIRISGWKSLKPYSVAIVTGWKILEENIVGTRSLTKVSSPESLFQLLAQDRADIVVFDRTQGNAVIKKLGVQGVYALTPLLARQAMFMYLNRRHAELARKLPRVLREMKRDGSFDRMIKSSMKGSEHGL